MDEVNFDEQLVNEFHTWYLSGELTQQSLDDLAKWLILMDLKYMPMKHPFPELSIYINSDGGDVRGALAVVDLMKSHKLKIKTFGLGEVCSSAFLIFVSGERGQRFITRNASLMMHEFSDSVDELSYSNQKGMMRENELLYKRMLRCLAEGCELTDDLIESTVLTPNDVYLSPEEMLSLGFADKII